MIRPYELSASRTVAVPPQVAFDLVLPLPMEVVFSRRYGPIAAVVGTTGHEGDWGSVGDRRTVHFADGGQIRHTLTGVVRPHWFAFSIDRIQGRLSRLAVHSEGLWSFDVDGAGTLITWAWTITPRNVLVKRLMPTFGFFWRGYADRALARIDELIRSGLTV